MSIHIAERNRNVFCTTVIEKLVKNKKIKFLLQRIVNDHNLNKKKVFILKILVTPFYSKMTFKIGNLALKWKNESVFSFSV